MTKVKTVTVKYYLLPCIVIIIFILSYCFLGVQDSLNERQILFQKTIKFTPDYQYEGGMTFFELIGKSGDIVASAGIP